MKAWIARDKEGELCIYYNIDKPRKGCKYWYSVEGEPHELDPNLFPEVRWEDEEPTEVEIIIKQIEK